MPALLDLVTPLLAGTALDPALRDLLAAVPTSAGTLPATSQTVGAAVADVAWRAVQTLLPLPPGGAAPFAGDVPVDARVLGPAGWEVGVALPALDVAVPGLTPGELRQLPDGRPAVAATPGGVSLHVPAVRAVLRAPNGDDVTWALGEVTASLVPAVVALPGGFGLSLGPVHIGEVGTTLPDVAVHLPPLPRLPTGPIAAPLTLRGRGHGLFARVGPVPLAGSPASMAAAVTVVIDRPDAVSLADLTPTLIVLDVPLEDITLPVPGGDRLRAEATGGGPLSLQATITLEGGGAALSATLTGGGADRGLARLTATTGGPLQQALTVAAAVGPYLVQEGPAGAALTALIGAAGGAGAGVGDPSELELVVHSVELRAAWTQAVPSVEDIDILLDYECQVPFAFSTGGVGARTRAGHPYRARHRNVRLGAGPMPELTWREATSVIVSPGEWVVDGVPEEVLRVADVLTRRGSLELELDLRLALDVGPVTLERSVWLVSLGDGGATLRPSSFAVSIDVPGALAGRGELGFGGGRVDAALAVRLPALGAGGRGAVAVSTDPPPDEGGMVMIAAQVDLFTPIPLANSGLGLYSAGGLMAYNARPQLPPGDPITAALGWDPAGPASWQTGDEVWMGLSARIGTVPDFGFALMGDCVILVGLPDPSLRASVEADLLGGITGSLQGVLLVDGRQLLIALRGHYVVPSLLELTVPAGAIFPFQDLSAWTARLGGDRAPDRGEPVTATILPDLLGLEAWMFLMAFGDASTVVGAAVAGGQGLQVQGLSVAFGAGFDVDWSAGPFSFSAGGVILAALTHRPSAPGAAAPWVLSGRAELRGSVDLGPVSIGASARLEAFVDPSAGAVHGDARACAKVDLWFTEIEGCVHLEIGDRPTVPAPPPASPLQTLKLTDRVGHVVATAAGIRADGPAVWPDTVPVLVFDTYVAMAPGLQGLGPVVGDSLPNGDGWIGTAELAYRFQLEHVKVFEEGGTTREIGTGWRAAWQLPLVDDVFGAGEPPARARSLALNVLDLHHWLQPAIGLPDDAPGHPVGILGRLCDEVPLPARWWFPGHGATLPPGTPTQLHVEPTSGQVVQPGDPTTLTVFVRDREFGSINPADSFGPAFASALGQSYRPPGIEQLQEPIAVEEHPVTGVCWLPVHRWSDVRAELLLAFDQPVRDVTVHTLTPEGRPAPTIGEGWRRVTVGPVGRWALDAWHSPTAVPLTDIVVRPNHDQPVGILSVSAVSERAARRRDAVESSRRKTHDELESSATTKKTPRRLMARQRDHRVEVRVSWQSRGTMYTANAGDFTSTFWFTTASAGSHDDPPPPPPGPPSPASIFLLSTVARTLFAESELADADLGRYVAGFVPPPGTKDWFCTDPVQVVFLVDHVTELAEIYDSMLTLTARRTDAAPGTAVADPAPTAIPVPTPVDPGLMVDPLLFTAFTVLDQQRSRFAATQEAPGGCRVRRPGAAASVPLVLEPEAAYRTMLTVDRTGGLGVGEGPVIAQTTFTTSRYADPRSLFLELGFAVGGAPTEPTVFPLSENAAPPADGATFEEALAALQLDGYRTGAGGGSAALWKANGAVWHFGGVLVECPEPIERPGRVHVEGVFIDDAEVTPIWDARRTRLLAVVAPGPPAGPVTVRFDVTHTRPGEAPVRDQLTAVISLFQPAGGGP